MHHTSPTPRGRFVAASAAAFATIGYVRAPAKAAQFELKCGTSDAVGDPRSVRLGQMWAAIQRESGGRIHAQFFPGSSLGSEDAMFSQLRLGALHFQSLSPGVLSAIIPAWNIPYLGFAFKDVNEALRVMAGPLGTYVNQETINKGMFACPGVLHIGMGHVCSAARPVRVPDDLRGLKIRTATNKISVDFFKILGASPTPITFAEVYPGLQTRLVEAVTAAITVVEATKWYEVLKYISLTTHIWYSNRIVANGDVWKSLPPDLQDVIQRNTVRFARLATKDVVDGEAALARKLSTEQGVTFNPVDQGPFQARLGGYYKEWSSEFGPTAWNMLQASLSHKLM